MSVSKPNRRVNPSEQGYILLFAIFLTALLVIALAIAAPQVAKSIQRDKELETFNRGMQYRRAIQLYYRKFHAYPPNADALVETNNIRFLRKKYLDPMTGKDDWKPILFGQNKAPTAMGFFGQPLAGSATTVAGIGPGGGNTGANGGAGGILPGGIGGLLTGTNDNSGNTSSGDTSGGNNGTGSSGDTSGTGNSGGAGSSPGSDQSGQSGQSGQTGQTGLSGQTFGGGGIIGFKPPLEKKSILVYKKKNHYNEWEFTYDPISDMQTMGGGNALGNGANSQNPNNNSGFGSGSGSGSGSTFGNGSSFGSGSGAGSSSSFGSGSSFGGTSNSPGTTTPQQ
ncbi:MAG: hypothetical protein WBP85_15240 [Terracidiphilus sp.]